MKKLFLLSVLVAVSSLVMAQPTFPDTVIGGQHYYNGSPVTFMVLPTSSAAINQSWVKPTYGSSYNNPTSTTGVYNAGANNFSHRFITQQGTDCDACYQMGTQYIDQQILPQAWDSDLHPGTYVDSVIQIGSPGSQGEKSQQIEYRFIPDKNNPILLLNFMFVLENKTTGSHNYSTNPRVDIELLNGVSNQRLNLGYYPVGYPNAAPGAPNNPNWPYSRFYIIAPGDGSGDHSQCTPVSIGQHECPQAQACHASSDVATVVSYQYTIVAFNLKDQALAHTPVKLKLMVRACDYTAHWAYCYYTVKMVPAELQVDYCTGDPAVHLSVPWGFDAQSYRWYNGADENNCHYASEVEELEGYPYNFYVDPDPANPYWRCEATSSTGVPFKYEATVKYIDLRPSFTVTPAVDSCKYNIRLANTSQIVVFTPDGQGGVDSTFQQLENNPSQCHWDFGDGTTTTGFTPCHTYSSNNPGPYTIRFYVTDVDNICQSDTIEQEIVFDPDYVSPQYDKDTVSTCESKLPYRYKPEIFGTSELTTWNLSAVGDHNVNYSNALPDYHIRSYNGCDSIVKVRFDVLTPTVVIEQVGEDFCDSAHTVLQAFVSNADEDAIRYEWTFMDSVMSRTEFLEAISDGTYSVSIVDANTDCSATNLYKIDPCIPNVFIPNCITPTDDRSDMLQNDYVYLDQFVLRFITDIKFAVYARNGEQVYYYEGKKNAASVFEPTPQFENLPAEMTNRLVLWNGYCGKKIVTGVYTYTLWIVSGKQQYLYKGSITVL